MADLSPALLEKLAAEKYSRTEEIVRELAQKYSEAKEKDGASAKEAFNEYISALEALKESTFESYEDVKRKALELSKRDVGENADDANGYGGIYQAESDNASTAQIIQDTALGNSLNETESARSDFAAQAELKARIAEFKTQTHVMKNAAEIEKSYIENQTDEDETAASIGLKKYKYLQDALEDRLDAENAARNFELEKRANDYAGAIKEMKTFGRVITKASAEILGVPIGTRKKR